MKTNQEIAIEVIEGKWGNNNERYQRLCEAGYDFGAIQSIVNALMSDPFALKKAEKIEPIVVRGTETLEVDVDLDRYANIKLNFRFGDADG